MKDGRHELAGIVAALAMSGPAGSALLLSAVVRGSRPVLEEMLVNFLKDEIEHAEQAIQRSIERAGHEITSSVMLIGREVASQRTLTVADLQGLVDYAAASMAAALDSRIEKAKLEVSTLVTDKLTEIRAEMSEVATMQKRAAIRNATFAVIVAVAVAVVSAVYKSAAGGGIDLYSTFRVVLVTAGAGHMAWLLAKYVSNYMTASKLKKDAAFYASHLLGAFRIKGIGLHLAVLSGIVACWVYVSFFFQLPG